MLGGVTDHAPPPPLDEPAPKPTRELFTRPPGKVFHGVALLLVIALLWLLSYPGGSLGLGLATGFALLVVLILWAVRGAFWTRNRGRGDATGNPLVFAIVPVGLVVVCLLAFTSAPLKARFSLAKGDFEDQVAAAPPATGPTEVAEFEVPDRIGSFDVDKAFRQGDAVVFEVPGGFFSTVGFAYLPSGAFDELDDGDLDNVTFTHLTGDWYTFSTSTD